MHAWKRVINCPCSLVYSLLNMRLLMSVSHKLRCHAYKLSMKEIRHTANKPLKEQ